MSQLFVKPMKYYINNPSMEFIDYTSGIPSGSIKNYSKITKSKGRTKILPPTYTTEIQEDYAYAKCHQLKDCKPINYICPTVEEYDRFPIKKYNYIPDFDTHGMNTRKMAIRSVKK